MRLTTLKVSHIVSPCLTRGANDMLCDILLAYPDSAVAKKAEQMAPPLILQRPVWTEFGKMLRNTPRFNLDRDAVHMVHVISASSPSRFATALNVCRMPFPMVWVEFNFKDRSAWLAEASAQGIKTVHVESALPPEKIGFLLKQLDTEGRDIMVHPAWVHTDGTASFCLLALRINTSPDFQRQMSPERVLLFKEKMKEEKWANRPDEVETAMDLDNRITEIIPDYVQGMWQGYLKTFSQEVCKRFVDMAHGDLLSEWRFVLALLTMLNSRNIFDIAPAQDLTKLNKSRGRTGKPPLLVTRTVHLSMSKVQKNRLEAGGSRNVMAHLVKGHFKIRSTGLFWWTPHVRGNIGTAPITPTYDVKK